MEKIVSNELLAPNINRVVVTAPLIAKNWRPGQFVIVHFGEESERIPLTICDRDEEKGEITLIIQAVGQGTREICRAKAGNPVRDIVGPLGKPTEIDPNWRNVLFVAGGIGIAPLFPLIKHFHKNGVKTTVLMGTKTADSLIMRSEVEGQADNLMISTDDGTLGVKGFALDCIAPASEKWGSFDRAFVAGPARMMQFTVKELQRLGIKSTVSLNPIMIDGTGMCGGCRVVIGGKTRFACVDGPEFDGDLVDFDKLVKKLTTYRDHECRMNKISE